MGIAIEPPGEHEINQPGYGRRVPDCAGLRGFSARRVLLGKNWWNGAVSGRWFAFYRNDRRAVAILPGTRNRYMVVDPMTGARRALTRAVALELAPEAVMFYRALPSRALLGRDLMQLPGSCDRRRADFFRIMLPASLGIGILTMAVPLVTQDPDRIPSFRARKSINWLICALALAIAAIVTLRASRSWQGIAMLRLESPCSTGVLQAGNHRYAGCFGCRRCSFRPVLFWRSCGSGAGYRGRACTIITGRAISRSLGDACHVFSSFAVMFLLRLPARHSSLAALA